MKKTGARRGLTMLGSVFFVLTSYGASCDGSAGPDGLAQIGRIDIVPAPLTLRPSGGTVQFTATARYNSGNLVDPQPTFTWASGNPVATIASTGPSTAQATLQSCNLAGCGTCSRITATSGDVVGEAYVALEGTIAQFPCPPK